MSCFDSYIKKCPNCGEPVEFQSKAGECDMLTYEGNSVPPEIAASVNGESRDCESCGECVTARFQILVIES